MTILIVDDDAQIRNFLVRIIREQGHKPIEAVDGSDGLWKLAQNPSIDLIILDLQMPNVNGYQFVEKAKVMTQAPILLHTAMPGAEKREGITEVVSKCDFKTLRKYMQEWPMDRSCDC